MSDSYVYFLRGKNVPAFKIGISCDPVKRIVALPQEIDIATSFMAPVVSGREYKAEQVLHYLFREYSYKMEYGDGYTEWFAIEVWREVLDFISSHKERLGLGDVCPIPIIARSPQKKEVPPAPSLTPVDEQETAEKYREWYGNTSSFNEQSMTAALQTLHTLTDMGVVAGVAEYSGSERLWLCGRGGALRLDDYVLTSPLFRRIFYMPILAEGRNGREILSITGSGACFFSGMKALSLSENVSVAAVRLDEELFASEVYYGKLDGQDLRVPMKLALPCLDRLWPVLDTLKKRQDNKRLQSAIQMFRERHEVIQAEIRNEYI
ncbi:hypothetical protein AmDm5_1360 [Acetobacter malorum]|uniref:GIY-YIG nuclease family protein n=1 Tax=Acetobacter persici TaxID=1076596 RepID=UPI0005005536|nr:GIY-YIG nuclease family protein [Acetobacter persici]KFL89913.1 hypothetical protein AmDm5_1360 [Acetobacter malorum]MCG0998895.1 GIY-YIG nuclease family protein [Acetobacter persici]